MAKSSTIRILDSEAEIARAAELSASEHGRLRSRLPFLPERGAGDFAPRINWMAREGEVLGMFEGSSLVAFLGGFVIEDYRNAGKGAFCPDWCHGALEGGRAFDSYRALYRELAPSWREKGAAIHAACAYSTAATAIEAFSLTGFGRIMMDAAAPTRDVIASLGASAPLAAGAEARRALPSDAAMASLDAKLASHIAASPVLAPDTRGRDEEQWIEWLGREGAVAFVAEVGGRAIGFIKAGAPQVDVSFSVHGEGTLAICGLFVEPSFRGAGIGRALLAAMAEHARESGKPLMSVDCETTNPEAYAFWPRWFRPLSWGLERRT